MERKLIPIISGAVVNGQMYLTERWDVRRVITRHCLIQPRDMIWLERDLDKGFAILSGKLLYNNWN